jgi:hypothetical protein
MSLGVTLVLYSMLLFELKHAACDFMLQTSYQYRGKGIYGHPGGFIHAGLHSIGSLPAILLLTQEARLVAIVFAAEFVVHYHVDWLKEQIRKRRALTFDNVRYWILFGADQLAHQATYLIIIAALARRAHL